ncbi:MAG: peptide deformylase [Acidimicrobiales bacterium]
MSDAHPEDPHPGDSAELAALAEHFGAQPYRASPWAGHGVTPFGADVLHTPTRAVSEFDDRLRDLGDYMIEVMHERDGIGLAANQIGLDLRLFVHGLPRVVDPVIVNPRITAVHDDTWTYEEGCLSLKLDGTYRTVVRPKRIRVEAQRLDGSAITIEADELLSRVFQHEIDHLDGHVFAQRVTGDGRSTLYQLMESAGVPTERLPELPLLSVVNEG